MKFSTLVLALKSKGKLVLDLADRAAFTFLAAFVAVYLPAILALNGGNWGSLADLSLLQKAAVAGGAGVATLLKGVIGSFFGDKNSGAIFGSADESGKLIEVPVALPPEAGETMGDTTVDMSASEVPAEETPPTS